MAGTTESVDTAAAAQHADPEHSCPSHFGVQGVGTLRCLLVSPHPRYRHYTADPERPQQFWTWTDEQAATLCRYRVNDLVRYIGTDSRWAGEQGRVLDADYSRRVPLVVELPGGPRGIGVCFADEHVEPVGPSTTPG